MTHHTVREPHTNLLVTNILRYALEGAVANRNVLRVSMRRMWCACLAADAEKRVEVGHEVLEHGEALVV